MHSFGRGCVCGNDAYSLQLNSNSFPTAECGKNAKCLGWEQFIYATPVTRREIGATLYPGSARQDHAYVAEVPSGAQRLGGHGGDCYYSSPAVDIPQIPITGSG